MESVTAVTVTRTPAYSSCIARTFQQLRLNDDITDFTIVSGKHSFNCHRVILAGSSPVLRAMVRSGMTEALAHKASLDTIPPVVMQLVLDYIYTGEVVISHEHLQKTIAAADFLQLLELKEICLGEAESSFKSSNIVSWYKFADRLDIKELKSKCAEVMSSFLAEVSRFTEFQELDFAEVNILLSSAKDTDADCDDLLEASMEWINYEPSHRINYMEELLQKIQLLECSVECLENEMEVHEALFRSSQAGYKLMAKALVQIAKQDSVRKKRGTKKNSQIKFVVIGGQHNRSLNKLCWELNTSLQLKELCQIPDHSFRFGVCKVPDGFVLTGGEDSTLCSMYVLSKKSWKQLIAMKSARCNHGSIFMNGRIFVFGGGRTRTSKSSSVHALALDGNKWTEEVKLPIKVSNPEVASIENSIFLLNTYGTELLNLDLQSRTWSRRQDLPTSFNCGARMIAVQNMLLTARLRYNSAAQYDPSTDVWTTLSSPTLSHAYGAMLGIGKNVYFIGGREEDRIEEYNLDTGIWSVCDARMPSTFEHLHALALDI